MTHLRNRDLRRQAFAHSRLVLKVEFSTYRDAMTKAIETAENRGAYHHYLKLGALHSIAWYDCNRVRPSRDRVHIASTKLCYWPASFATNPPSVYPNSVIESPRISI